jgi:8-hydroxy-5-deazaflavin:NADPH oxidoreductase
MKIGIIGAGHVGCSLAKRFTQTGHEVLLANSRGPVTLTTVAIETGATPVEARPRFGMLMSSCLQYQ